MNKNLIITQRHAPDRHGSPTDSLENAYVECFSALGFTVFPIPTTIPHPDRFVSALDPVAIVLSGGGDVAPDLYGGQAVAGQSLSVDRDRLEFQLLDFAVRERVPVLGICRGMQMINVYYGGSLDSTKLSAAHNAEDLLSPHQIMFEDSTLLENFPEGCQVNSYHCQSVPLNLLGQGLACFACHGNLPLAEGIRHQKLPIAGIQWHPERSAELTPLDRLLLGAFRDRRLFWEVSH